MLGLNQNLGQIGSAVLTFIGYKQTTKQEDRQAMYWIYLRLRNMLSFVENSNQPLE